MAGRTTSPGATVARRLLSVLDCFDDAHGRLTLTQVAERSQLPLSTAKRLVGELVGWGGLERGSDGRYCIGMRLWEVGSYAPQHRGLREAAMPFLQDLYEATRENVELVVLDGSQALVVEKIFGARAVATETDLGGRLPLHATSAGKALLAFAPRRLLADVAHAGPVRYTPHTIVEPGKLAAAVGRARQARLAYAREEKVLGTVSVASPVLGAGDTLVAAIAVVARVGTRIERLGPAVRTAALGVSRSMLRPAEGHARTSAR